MPRRKVGRSCKRERGEQIETRRAHGPPEERWQGSLGAFGHFQEDPSIVAFATRNIRLHSVTKRMPVDIDYSVYLVTGRELLPPGQDYYEHLHKTLAAGDVTVVQVREKEASDEQFLDIATKTLEICDKVGAEL